jgi:hypothetical protein
MKIKQVLLIFAIILISPAVTRAASEDAESKKCGPVHQAPVAVFIGPSDKKIEAMKREGEEGFYTIADDAMYYQAQAMEFLEKMKFPYCFTENEKHVFKTDGNKQYAVNEKCEAWCLILWNGKDKPVSTYTIDISMQESYLKRAKLK